MMVRLFMVSTPTAQQVPGAISVVVVRIEPMHGAADGNVSPGAKPGADMPGIALGAAIVVPGTVPGTVIGGLRPRLVVSVALNGMLAPLSVGSLPEAGSGGVLLPADGWRTVAVQSVNPPPSKVPLEGVAQVVSGIGLKPPGLISVAPSGMPDGADVEVAPGMPSGEVAPIAGGLPRFCAWAAPDSVRIATNVGRMRRMDILQIGSLCC
jgi:hypothetical protein